MVPQIELYNYVVAAIQLIGLVALIWYTIETSRMRKQNDRLAKATEERHLLSIRPIISISSATPDKHSIISELGFVITNAGNGAALDVEALSFKQGEDLCSYFTNKLSCIYVKESKVVSNYAHYGIKKKIEDLAQKYGEEVRDYFSSLAPLKLSTTHPICHIIVFYRDMYGNVYAMQRDLFIKTGEHGTAINGEEKRVMVTNLKTP